MASALPLSAQAQGYGYGYAPAPPAPGYGSTYADPDESWWAQRQQAFQAEDTHDRYMRLDRHDRRRFDALQQEAQETAAEARNTPDPGRRHFLWHRLHRIDAMEQQSLDRG
jgi:hypothetical protein